MVHEVRSSKYGMPFAGASNARGAVALPVTVALYILASLLIIGLGSLLGPVPADPGRPALLSPAAIWQALMGTGSGTTLEAWLALRVLPLVFAGCIGATLALGGVVFQAALRNPLAEPYILGVSGAASLGVLIAHGLASATVALVAGPLGALVGALAAIGFLLGLARWAQLRDPASLILAGTVLNAIFGAAILVVYALAAQRQWVSSLLWLMGSTGPEATLGRPFALPLAAATLGVACILFVLCARWLDLLALGTEDAADLGIDPERVRVRMLVGASIVTACAVAVAGPIGFVGLVVPHCVRRLHGASHRRLVPLAALAGAAFLMLADLVARNVLRPQQLPVGAVTALVGGPFFLALLARARRHGQTGESP